LAETVATMKEELDKLRKKVNIVTSEFDEEVSWVSA
jgi:hypothetical protein